MTVMRASCHCDAVMIEAEFPHGLASAARCDCSFCIRRGAAAVTAIADTLKVLEGADNLALYSWGTGTAQHWFCRTCGIYTHHRRRSNPAECGVNLGCIEGANPRTHGDIPWTDAFNHPSDRGKA